MLMLLLLPLMCPGSMMPLLWMPLQRSCHQAQQQGQQQQLLHLLLLLLLMTVVV